MWAYIQNIVNSGNNNDGTCAHRHFTLYLIKGLSVNSFALLVIHQRNLQWPCWCADINFSRKVASANSGCSPRPLKKGCSPWRLTRFHQSAPLQGWHPTRPQLLLRWNFDQIVEACVFTGQKHQQQEKNRQKGGPFDDRGKNGRATWRIQQLSWAQKTTRAQWDKCRLPCCPHPSWGGFWSPWMGG